MSRNPKSASLQTNPVQSGAGSAATVMNGGGPTSLRPVNPPQFFNYFDTTLNRPVYYFGTQWVDPIASYTVPVGSVSAGSGSPNRAVVTGTSGALTVTALPAAGQVLTGQTGTPPAFAAKANGIWLWPNNGQQILEINAATGGWTALDHSSVYTSAQAAGCPPGAKAEILHLSLRGYNVQEGGFSFVLRVSESATEPLDSMRVQQVADGIDTSNRFGFGTIDGANTVITNTLGPPDVLYYHYTYVTHAGSLANPAAYYARIAVMGYVF